MLHAKVLSSGLGHTTRCFLQVEGSPTGEKYILTENSDEQKSLESIDSLSNALCAKDMGEDALLRVFWPKNDSKLLTNEVVLLDSPGVDLSPQFDSWIDKHCLDADVFVLVSNAESTLTQTEKNFFHRVKTRLSKPNLFILNNRWDASAAEPEYMEKVRKQHMQQFLKFFVEELGVCTLEEAETRVFFVSAREILQYRLRNKGITMSPTSYMAEGHESRMMEFEEFERRFELCISQSAIETKFESHIKNGEHIMDSVYAILDKLQSSAAETKQILASKLNEKLIIMQDLNDKYSAFSAGSSQELNRLSHFVQVQELIEHIGNVMANDLQVRFTGGLLEAIINRQRTMIAEAAKCLPQTYEPKAFSIMQYRQPFRFSFAIHLPSLMLDFQHDLEFRFWLAPTQLIAFFVRNKASSNVHGEHTAMDFTSGELDSPKNNLFGSCSFIPKPVSCHSFQNVSSGSISNDDFMVPSVVYSSAAYIANGGVGLMLVGGLVFRAIGWRIVVTGMSIYGLLYLYERLNWNTRTKERTLKKQVQKHLAFRLRQMAKSVTINCDDQVKKEMNEISNRLEILMKEAQEELKLEVNQCEGEVSKFDALLKQFDKIKKRSVLLSAQLLDFISGQMKPL
uniref:Dynamin-type G domain-containing protein n=1 Tax=Romanomermis culicivorax TaxID=13658 RepID=A0A915L1S2_ROMCU